MYQTLSDSAFLLAFSWERSPSTLYLLKQKPQVQIQRRFLYSYLGVGVNLGLTGETPLSETNFTVYSKILLTPSLSLRPSVIIGNNAEFLIPVTYDFSRAPIGEGIPRVVPFLGGGIAILTGDTSEVDLLLTGGVDIPLSRQLTATATLNLTPFNSFDVGVLLGLAYNFDSRLSVVRAAAVNPEFQRPRRPNPSYIGIGGNIGISGSSSLGNSSFAVIGKVALTDYVSIRPSIFIEDNATFLIPATYDFPLIRTEFISLAPYLGAGISFSTGDDSTVDAVLTGGVDIPITSGLAATAAINITPFDGFDWGAMVGLALTFGSF